MQDKERYIRIHLYRAELNIDLYDKIKKFIEGKSIYFSKEKFLIFTANNAFNEAVSIIASLIGQDKSEINLQKLGIQIPELEKIREIFENQNFSTIRDKLIAHKDKSLENDPTEHIFQLVLPEKVQQLSKIKDELNKIVYRNFKHPFNKNNPFVEPLKGLHEILNMF